MDLSTLMGSARSAAQALAGGLTAASRIDPKDLIQRLGRDQLSTLTNTLDFSGTGGNATYNQSILSAMRGRGDPLLGFNWYCELPPLGGMGSASSLGWEYVEEATLPFPEYEQQSNYRAGGMLYYPGHRTLSTLTLKVFENSNSDATQYFQTWQSLLKNPLTGQYGNPVDFKKPVKFTIFDVAKRTAMFLTYVGCWPTQQDPLSLQSATSDRINPSITLSADDLLLQFGSYDQGSIPSIVDNAIGAKTVSRLSDVLKSAASKLTLEVSF